MSHNKATHNMKTKLDDMTWPEVDEALKMPNAMLIPVGSIEQHGPHLPLSADFRIVAYLAEQAAKKVIEEHQIRVLVAPTIKYTNVRVFESFPGTVGVSIDTQIRVINDITRNFIKQGFKNIIYLNGHGDNVTPISAALRQVFFDFRDAGLYAVSWSALGYEVIPKVRKSKTALHAEELETSMSLVIQPDNVDLDKAVKYFPSHGLSEKWISQDFLGPRRLFYYSRKTYPKYGTDAGVMGDPTVASRETGEKIIEAVVNNLADLIVEIVESENNSK